MVKPHGVRSDVGQGDARQYLEVKICYRGIGVPTLRGPRSGTGLLAGHRPRKSVEGTDRILVLRRDLDLRVHRVNFHFAVIRKSVLGGNCFWFSPAASGNAG